MLVSGSMLMQVVAPAFATVSQVPALYISPPDTNVMFTLDDSGSMGDETIPDSNGLVVTNNIWSSAFNSTNALDKFKITSAQWRYYRSPTGNPLYYNPTVTYKPWPFLTNDTLNYPPALPTAACYHAVSPVLPAALGPANITCPAGNQRNLAARVIVNAGDNVNLNNEDAGYWPATYFTYTGAAGTLLANGDHTQGSNVQPSFTKVEIRPTLPGSATPSTYAKAASRTDCTGATCTYAEEIQNFANYFTYYRNRLLMAKGGVSQGFAKQGTNLRVGFGTINSGSSTVDGAATATVTRGVRTFSDHPTDNTKKYRKDFYTRLYAAGGNSGTPLRRAADDVGKYFQRTGGGNPWAEDPSNLASAGKEYTCRKSFHILSTDGFWNGTAASSPANADNDNFSTADKTPPNHRLKNAAFPAGRIYDYGDNVTADPSDPLVGRFTINPFRDSPGSDRLADVAAYYWKTDLRPTLDNEILPTSRDPAFWQHLTMFTVGLGITGTGLVTKTAGGAADLSTQASRDLLISTKTALNWTAPADDNPATGDDLIHTALNGHGRYFSATNPSQLAVGLASALNEVASNPASLTSLAVQSLQVEAGNDIYQSIYNPDKWYGRLYSFQQAVSGSVSTALANADWEASNKMPAPSARNIFTWNPLALPLPAATPFLYGNLNAVQQGNLALDPTLVDYLRGSGAKEAQNGGTFRDRSRYAIGAVPGGVLGDVINGSPIKGPDDGGGFDRLPSAVPGQSTYAAYRADIPTNTTLNNLRKTLFLGANDGMLHAFDATTGVERFAFVPNSVYSVPRSLTGTEAKLKMLSDPAYTHRMLVDGPPQIADAYNSTAWKTYLVSSTGVGARSVFAMDVTNPVVETGGFDNTKILWEFSEANNADMGYVINYPHIARMKSKADGSGGAWVAIFGNGYDSVNGQAKLFILDLFTGAVVKEISVGTAGGNGLSQPNFTVNSKREVTAIYAGDLQGNLWKFDVDFDNPADYKVALSGSPLYTGSANQPITVMPEITFHPNGGTLLSFGTGKIFEIEDTALTGNVNLNTQSLIGIWDKPLATTGVSGKTTLVQQTNAGLAAAVDASLSGTTTNAIDWTTKRGWYMDLGSGGERVNVNPQQVKNVLLIVANKPDSDPCKTGGSSRLFALNPITGGAPDFAVFDANAAGGITAADKGYNVKAITYAVLSLPTLLRKSTAAPSVGLKLEAIDSRGKTGERLGGVEDKAPPGGNDCDRWLLAGGSDTSISGFDISVCSKNKPRVSWRQIR